VVEVVVGRFVRYVPIGITHGTDVEFLTDEVAAWFAGYRFSP